MEVPRGCEKCLKSVWKCLYTTLSVLLLVTNCTANDAAVHFRLHSSLHTADHSREFASSQVADSKPSSAYTPSRDSISDISREVENPRDLRSSHETAAVVDMDPAASLPGESYHDDDFSTTEPPCDLCESLKLTRQQLDFVHIEMTKQRILDKLRLEAPPNITAELPPLPQALLKQGGSHSRDQEEEGTEAYYAESQQVILLTESARVCEDDRKAVCFRIDLKRPIGVDEIRSLKFHVYRKSSPHLDIPDVDTLELYEHTLDGDRFLTKQVVEGRPDGRSWLPFKIPRRLLNFLATNVSEFEENQVITKHLKLKCNNCNNVQAFLESEMHQPYLEVKTQEPRSINRRSTVECTDGRNECCLVRLYVSFASIGWDRWIKSPAGYNANYCAGSCRGRHELPAYQHSRIMMGLSDEQQRTAATHYHPCCSPTLLSPITLIYMDPNTLAYNQKVLPNMTVTACGCA